MPVIAGLGLTRDDPPAVPPPAPCVSFSGTVGGVAVHVVCNGARVEVLTGEGGERERVEGSREPQPRPPFPSLPGKCPLHGVDNVGTVPAAVVSYLAMQALQPDLVISAGTAGGFSARGAAVGDVFLATSFANHDRRIPMPAFEEYGVWAVEAAPAPRLAAAAGLKTGAVSTGNSMDWHALDMEAMNATNAVVKEMEAAGVAWVAHLFGAPMLALKAVTDIVDGGGVAQDEFLANLATATAALHDKLAACLAWLGEGVAVEDL